ncbi:MAG: S-layer homology domain-containing protein, partial [Clostridia bacterium]|nr:S-layer homology domain-containing protein [Clostridia bacterium]
MMKRRVLSALLVIILIISLSVPVFAVTYTDLTNHWAKQYLESLADGGYLTGYSDGTMRPDNNITTLEALTVLSRMYSLTTLETEMVQTDYEATVKGLVAPNLSWGYKNIEICLAAGIITLDELKGSSLTGAIQKEKLSLYLVRTMQLSAAAAKLGVSSLTFADASKVSAACIGSVAELVSLGVVKGDSSNNFSPQSNVTRAVVATMISRSLDYLKANNKTLVIEAYSGTVRQEGIISSVSDGSMQLCGFDGLTSEYAVSSEASVTVNGTNVGLGSSYVGCYAKVTEKNGVVVVLSIDYDSTVSWVQGAVTSVSATSTSNLLYIKSKVGAAALSYTVPSAAAITRSDASVALSTLTAGDFVTVKLVNGTVTA